MKTATLHSELTFGKPFQDSGVVAPGPARDSFLENLLVRTHCIIEMIWWTGLALWEFEFPFPGSLTFTFLVPAPPSHKFRTLAGRVSRSTRSWNSDPERKQLSSSASAPSISSLGPPRKQARFKERVDFWQALPGVWRGSARAKLRNRRDHGARGRSFSGYEALGQLGQDEPASGSRWNHCSAPLLYISQKSIPLPQPIWKRSTNF